MTENAASLVANIFEEYDFQNILDYMFNTSDPFWRRTSSTVRASSLFRRVLSWATVLKMVVSHEFDELESFLQRVSAFDANAGQWLLERLPGVLRKDKAHTDAMPKVYSSIILGDSSDLVKTTAISNLTCILEAFLAPHRDIDKLPDLPWEVLIELSETPTGIEAWNREMTEAMLRLHGCLLAVKAISARGQSSGLKFETELRQWTIRLRYAIQEETVSSAILGIPASL